MGIFHEQVVVVNRAPVTLTVRFDGQDTNLKPGRNSLPKAAVEFAKNQNPIMGSASPTDPSIAGARYLIAEVGVDRKEDCVPLTEEEWQTHLKQPMRLNVQEMFDERYGGDPKARMVVHGQKHDRDGRETSPARNRSEAGGSAAPAASTFEGDRA